MKDGRNQGKGKGEKEKKGFCKEIIIKIKNTLKRLADTTLANQSMLASLKARHPDSTCPGA